MDIYHHIALLVVGNFRHSDNERFTQTTESWQLLVAIWSFIDNIYTHNEQGEM